jgi:prepilin signal peptidase PulO-like enzyme (type II secretory pathway)
MNAALDILNTVLDAVIGALAVGLQAAARAALANTSAAEWVLAVALAGAAWMLSSGRGWRAVGLLAFSLAVAAGAWLSWKTGHGGMVAQQAVLAAMVLHGLKGRGWTLAGKGSAR